MTEHALYSYIDFKKQLLRAKERLVEINTLAVSPSSPSFTATFGGGDSTDKLPNLLDKLFKAQQAVDDLAHKTAEAADLLRYVEELLDRAQERDVLFHRYMLGETVDQMEINLHRSRSAIYRSRDKILEVVEPITYVCF